MKTKICRCCNIEKNIDKFPIRKSNKDGYYSYCKQCATMKSKEYYENNKEKVMEYHKKSKKVQQYLKKYRKEYYKKNKEDILEKQKEKYKNNKELYSRRNKKYRDNHKEKMGEYFKEYRKTHRKDINKKYLERKNKDSLFKFKCNIRGMIKKSFNKKGFKKKYKSEIIFGCSIDNLIKHLIKTYEDNYNEEWKDEYLSNVHIDHIKPLKCAKNEEEVIKLCHYSNLQLLKAKDNLCKSSKLDWSLNDK